MVPDPLTIGTALANATTAVANTTTALSAARHERRALQRSLEVQQLNSLDGWATSRAVEDVARVYATEQVVSRNDAELHRMLSPMVVELRDRVAARLRKGR